MIASHHEIMLVTSISNVIALIAACICLSFTLGIWHMVKARSRLALLIMSAWLVFARSVYLIITALPPESWVKTHTETVQAIVLFMNLPMWFLLAYAFGLTYYELRHFHFTKNGGAKELTMALESAEEEQ